MTTDFKLQIRILMVRKGINSAQLSRKADISSGAIYNFLSGKTDLNMQNLKKVLDTLNELPDVKKGN